jgi:hypothetical protein
MSHERMRGFFAAVILVLTVLSGPGAHATLLVPMSDQELVDSSSLIVIGEIVRMESLELAQGRIVTAITLAVEDAVKGTVAGDTVVITEPGGQVAGRVVHIHGAPPYVVGKRVLAFLSRARDGTMRTNGLALGCYGIDSNAFGVPTVERRYPSADARRLDDFVATLRGLAGAGPHMTYTAPQSSYRRDAVAGEPVVGRFTFLDPQAPARWFEPDMGLPVRLFVANSEATLGQSKSERVIADALAVWTNVQSASIVLENAGTTSAAPSVAGGFCDDESMIQFNDPLAELPDLRPRSDGTCTGVFAVGGYCADRPVTSVGNVSFLRIYEGDTTVNNRAGACVTNERADLTETVAHELGHVIGLGHSSERVVESNELLREALMYAFVHHDGRGGRLNSDDVAGISAVYPGPFDPCSEVDCDDGDPCSIDTCEWETGSCINDLKGDSDADGLCDPIDPCPLQPNADPTDLNGDGVGDGCQCAELRPGRCVPGRGGRRCLVEWRPDMAAPVIGNGLPSPRLRCTDGDPGCDTDLVPGQCTFRVALCINNEDPRLPGCIPTSLKRLAVKLPKSKGRRDEADRANAAMLASAINLEAQGLNLCSDRLPILVPTRGARRGTKRLKIRGVTKKGQRGRAKLKLTCYPAR